MLTIHFFASILTNIAISILAFVPSIFLTAWNVKVFGLIGGIFVGIIGEAIGATIAFYLYRKGFRSFVSKKTEKYQKLKKLLHVTGKDAATLIIAFRFMPFIPSSLVTLFAALGKVSFSTFFISSTLGKIPALVIETYSVYFAFQNIRNFQWILLAIGIILICGYWTKQKRATDKS